MMETIGVIDVLETVDDLDALESSGDESAETDDVGRHKDLLKSLGVEEKVENNKKHLKDQRSEATEDVSVFSLVGSRRSKSKLNADDLLRGLKESVKVNVLKKNLARVEKSQKHLKAPLPRVTAEKTARKAAYHSTSKKISRWQSIVDQNRRAEHISFPLNHENLQLNTVDDYVRRFKPKTPLEQQIYEVLKGSKYEERPGEELSLAEEEALKSVSLQEAKQRRAELQKHRALLSYYESKNRRLGKIKSRRHLRIIRKQKEKKSATDFQELEKRDPEGAATTVKRAEKIRAEERAALRHRQGSKWAKNRMLMAKYDEMTKVQIQEQKKLHSELTQKSLGAVESSDDESSDENNNSSKTDFIPLVPPTASQQTLYLPKDNPWLKLGTVEKKDARYEAMEEVQTGNDDVSDAEASGEASKSVGAILGLKAVGQDSAKNSDAESSDEEVDELQDELLEIRERKNLRERIQDGGRGNQNGGAVEEESITNFKAAFADLKKDSKKRSKTNKKSPENASENDDQADESEDEEMLIVDTDRLRSLEDMDQVLKTEGSITSLTELHKSSKRKPAKKKKTEQLEYIAPEKVFTLPTQAASTATPKTVENEDEGNTSEEEDANRTTIMEAFADDDVIADFVAEKRKNISDSKPKVLDLTLPGWGEWGGVGLKPSKRRRRRFLSKPVPPQPRKDGHLGHVIINEKRDVHIAMHQVKQIPFPFTSDEQFERSIRQPIGTTWNTPSTFKELTEPKVTTIVGAIIDPMDEDDAFDDTKPQQRKRVVHGDGNIGFDDIMQGGARKRIKRGNKKHKK